MNFTKAKTFHLVALLTFTKATQKIQFLVAKALGSTQNE